MSYAGCAELERNWTIGTGERATLTGKDTRVCVLNVDRHDGGGAARNQASGSSLRSNACSVTVSLLFAAQLFGRPVVPNAVRARCIYGRNISSNTRWQFGQRGIPLICRSQA